MQIDIRADFDHDRVRSLISGRVTDLAIDPDSIATITIASSDADYGDVIRASKGFTGGRTHTTGSAGKTLPYRNSTGVVVSDLVLPPETVREILLGNSDYAPLYDYVLSHELGHCSDYNARGVLQGSPLDDFSVGIEELAAYWAPLTLEEFAASVHAGRTVSPVQYDMIVGNAERQIMHGMGNPTTFRYQRYWNILCEQAKVAGTSIGAGSRLEKPAFCKWARIGDNIITQLLAYVEDLKAIQRSYPEWNSETEKLLTQRCLQLHDTMK